MLHARCEDFCPMHHTSCEDFCLMLHTRYEEFCLVLHTKNTKCEGSLFVLDGRRRYHIYQDMLMNTKSTTKRRGCDSF